MLKITDKTNSTYMNPRDMEVGHYYKIYSEEHNRQVIGLVTNKEDLKNDLHFNRGYIAYIDVETGFISIEGYDSLSCVEELDVEIILTKKEI